MVDAVVDDRDLLRRHAIALDQVAARALGDGDDLRGGACGQALGDAQLPSRHAA